MPSTWCERRRHLRQCGGRGERKLIGVAAQGADFKSIPNIRILGRFSKVGIPTLFGDFDNKVTPLLNFEYDHAMLINVHDPLYETRLDHNRRTGESLRMKTFEAPTSVKNLAHKLFTDITDLGFRLSKIEVRETDTSVLTYTREDWVADNRILTGSKAIVSQPTNAANTMPMANAADPY